MGYTMTTREIDRLAESLGREIKQAREMFLRELEQLRTDFRDMGERSTREHEQVGRKIDALDARLGEVESAESIEESRRAFRRSLIRAIVAINAAAATFVNCVLYVIDHL